MTISASVELKPIDSRCRYWGKLIRAGEGLPAPLLVSGANDIPGPYHQQGEEELEPGDILIEGEEKHHRKNRGWDYWVSWCGADGAQRKLKNPSAEIKATMKEAGMDISLLKGSGPLAACIRVGHGVRLGFITDDIGEIVE